MSAADLSSKILLIDDDPSVHHLFHAAVDKLGHQIVAVSTGDEALRLVASTEVDVIFVDVVLPDRTGLDLLQAVQRIDAQIPVVLMTARGTSDSAIEAIKLGAFDYLLMPLDLTRLRALVFRVCEIRRQMKVPVEIAESPSDPDEDREVLVGHSEAMQEVYKAIGRVAPRDVSVLIRGESGTGKELVARAVFSHGLRVEGPYLAINCAAIPEPLLESELFGHEKGAFTGADRRKIGKFEQYSGGTLFLDEIGDMSPMLQSKVLRVLQERQFQRVGGNETIHTDVRIIAATNRDLESAVRRREFREDLYYRLDGYTITIPPLRERPEDILLLTDHFLRRYRHDMHKEVRTIASETMDRLRAYPWPGNVRELQNVIRRSLLLASGLVLLPVFLPTNVRAPGPTSPPSGARLAPDALDRIIEERLRTGVTDIYDEVLAAMDRRLLVRVLEFARGNQHQAARILGLSRNTLRSKIRKLGIHIDSQIRSDENEPATGPDDD